QPSSDSAWANARCWSEPTGSRCGARMFPSCSAWGIGLFMASPLPTREEIVRCLKESSRAVHAGMLAKQCDVDKSSYRQFMDFLNELADEGVLRREGPKRFKLEQKKQLTRDGWNGVVTVNPRGF